MGLFRLLFWVAIIAAAFWLWRRITRPAPRAPEQQSADTAVPMVRCQHCGTHVPREQALADNQQWFCSQAHRELGPKSSGR